MPLQEIVEGVLIDSRGLSLDELARACAVEPTWVIERVESGILLGRRGEDDLQFCSADLARARRLVQVERDFDANEDLAALVVDLCDEVHRLKSRLRAAGMS